jgi:DNA-binding transcriptional MerR regulator
VTDRSLPELASIAGVTPRTVRYYVAQGLVPPPSSTGRGATYGDEHLARLRLIKRLQAEHFPLAEIRARLSAGNAPDAREFGFAHQPQPVRARAGESAVDYVHQVLVASNAAAMPAHPALPSLPSAALSTNAFDAPDETLPEPSGELSRSQWDRLSLAPDIELHIRRPLSRPLNKKVERLVAIARQLLKEDQP